MKGVFMGSGADSLKSPQVFAAFLSLLSPTLQKFPKERKSIKVCYLGTTTYDLTQPYLNQMCLFIEQCTVFKLCITNPLKPLINDKNASLTDIKNSIDKCDICIISGGNTLYAMNVFKLCGFDESLRKAVERGCVVGGGSAGAIMWFDGGHSDSADPATYRVNMLNPSPPSPSQPWSYIRVPVLSFLPGLICPHFDRIQSNGIPRSSDFDSMLLRHSNERGVCIDHYAGLIVNGDDYKVVRIDGEKGSVDVNGEFSIENGVTPGVWIKDVDVKNKKSSGDGDSVIVTRLVKDVGKVKDVWRKCDGSIIGDDTHGCEKCTDENQVEGGWDYVAQQLL